MKLIDLNTTGGIGANSTYLEIGPFRLVIDSGIHPKMSGREAMPAFDRIPAGHIDAIILTHCHLDHLGALPILARKYSSAPIITSIPSALLGPRMMHNSVSIMSMQREELGIKEYPLYNRADVERTAQQMLETPFKRTRYIERDGQELGITLYPSGHVAGAASVLLTYRHRNIFITGDILFEDQWTIGGAQLPSVKIDTLIMETTRGTHDRQASREEESVRLLKMINETLRSGSPVLIPVFALGRMQEMLMLFADARRNGRLLPAPIYCSGLGVDLIDYFDELHRKTNTVRFSRKLVKELRVKPLDGYVDPHEGRLNSNAIYLVSAGMMTEKTPSYGIAATIFDDPKAGIFFVGYCDEETPGGEILKLKKGDDYFFRGLDYQSQLHAQVERFDLSGHADRAQLLQMARDMAPRAIVLTHGEAAAREFFMQQLSPTCKVIDPIPLKEYEV